MKSIKVIQEGLEIVNIVRFMERLTISFMETDPQMIKNPELLFGEALYTAFTVFKNKKRVLNAYVICRNRYLRKKQLTNSNMAL